MAISAIKTGAVLPIIPSDRGRPPCMGTKQIVKRIPETINQTRCVSLLHVPQYITREIQPPQTFASIIHVSFDT